MESHGRTSIRFTLNGRRYDLSREDVADRLVDVLPDAIRKHAVRVGDTWYPVIQAFESATGIPRSEFMSNTARRHLASLGYEVSGEVEPRATPPASRSSGEGMPLEAQAWSDSAPSMPAAGEWHTEANVQAALVTALAGEGWRILSVANTATRPGAHDTFRSPGPTAGSGWRRWAGRSRSGPFGRGRRCGTPMLATRRRRWRCAGSRGSWADPRAALNPLVRLDRQLVPA